MELLADLERITAQVIGLLDGRDADILQSRNLPQRVTRLNRVAGAARVRRDGGIAIPPPALRTDNKRITRYELVRREVLAMLFSGAALILLAIFLPAPLDEPITQTAEVLGEARAPWFFLWIQQMLKWGDPFFWGVVVPVLLLVLLALIPYIFPKPADRELGRWFPKSNRLAQVTLAVIVLVVIILSIVARLSMPGGPSAS